MSRVAKAPISIPKGVEITFDEVNVKVKGPKGSLEMVINNGVKLKRVEEDGNPVIQVEAKSTDKKVNAIAGTTRALVNNMVIGVSVGFEKKLELVGVGYRAQVKGDVINLSLGFSHPVDYKLPAGVSAETPSNTVIILKSIDKQRLGQVGAEIKSYRPPEPYKGKGIKYANEIIKRKETKKK